MKQFFKILFASLFGAILAIAIIFFIFIGIIAASSAKPQTYAKKNVLVLKNVINIQETTPPETPLPFNKLEQETTLGVTDIIRSLEIAAQDDRISGIVLYDAIPNSGYTSAFEVAKALEQFKLSGKFVMSYNTMFSQKSYLLAAAGNEISMNREGMAEFHGISSSSIHYKNLLEKIGLKPVVIRCGKYKSYVESMTQEKMSEENRFQKQTYIDELWKIYSATIEEKRNIPTEKLNSIADSVLICTPGEMLSHGFIDKIQYADEFWNDVKFRMGLKESDKVSAIPLKSYIDENAEKIAAEAPSDNNVALVIAQGDIDMGKSDEKSIGSETYAKIFKDVRADSSVKAVVFRINSGGGSALASELIWREVSLTAACKPVIVSMGDLAASGGYYIAAPATCIVASPTTLTGSIGVFGMSVTAEAMLNTIGISTDKVNTHAHSDFGNIARDIDPTETLAIQKSIDKTYETFKQRVADGRHLPIGLVEEIAQGRVWSGTDALKMGLVDTLGDLTDAMQIAIETANLQNAEYKIITFPKNCSWMEIMIENLDPQTNVVEKLAKDSEILSLLKHTPTKTGVYTQIPYLISIK